MLNLKENFLASSYDWLWLKINSLGQITSGLIGLFVIVKMIKFVVNLFINGVLLKMTFGFTWHMVSCFWTNLSNLLIYRKHQYANNKGINSGANISLTGSEEHNLPELLNEATPPVEGDNDRRGLYPNMNASQVVEIPQFAGQRV